MEDTLKLLSQKKGTLIGRSDWIKINQSMINQFAELTNDNQPIHLDKNFALSQGFENSIAHGFLIISMLSNMANQALPKIDKCKYIANLWFDKLKIANPVYCNNEIRAEFILENYNIFLNKIFISYKFILEIKGTKKTAAKGLWLLAAYF